METKKILYFDDRVPYYKNTNFVDYPVVKIGSRNSGKVMIYVYMFLLSSIIYFII
jgi:hypothetical protein